MRIFRDSYGRQWSVTIDAGARDRVREYLGVDLLTAGGDFWLELSRHPDRYAAMCYAICRPQAEAMGVSVDEFGRMLDDEADRLIGVILEAVTDEFPRRVRRLLRQR